MCEPINRYKFQSSTEKPYVESTIRWKRTTEALPGLYPDKRVLFYGPKFGIAHGRYEQGVFYVNGSPMRVPLEFVTWWAYEPAAPREEQIMADKRSNDIMAVNDKIKEMAHKEAFRYYFSNVDDYDWPDDPDAFIEKVVWRSEEDECEVAELSYDDENGKCMDVWAPFENYTISAIRELMADFEIALINFYNEAKKLDKEE